MQNVHVAAFARVEEILAAENWPQGYVIPDLSLPRHREQLLLNNRAASISSTRAKAATCTSA